MTRCALSDSPEVELYFYDELDPVDRVRVAAHVRACEACGLRLDDLAAIRRALAARPVVDAPPAGDWSGFMRRLDRAVASSAEPANPRTVEPWNPGTLESSTPGTLEPWNLRTLLALAALLTLATIGVVISARSRAVAPAGVVANPAPVVATRGFAPTRAQRALREGSVEHLERSKLVVLGLATRDPRAPSADWQYERTLAGELLSDTRLYRQAALDGGAPDVERVMRDLETVLLEASMSDTTDRDALERVQRLIDKRDLLVKMQVVTAAGPSGD